MVQSQDSSSMIKENYQPSTYQGDAPAPLSKVQEELPWQRLAKQEQQLQEKFEEKMKISDDKPQEGAGTGVSGLVGKATNIVSRVTNTVGHGLHQLTREAIEKIETLQTTRLRQRFPVDKEEMLLYEYSCIIFSGDTPCEGNLYITTDHVGFWSDSFCSNFIMKLWIPLDNVVSIQRGLALTKKDGKNVFIQMVQSEDVNADAILIYTKDNEIHKFYKFGVTHDPISQSYFGHAWNVLDHAWRDSTEELKESKKVGNPWDKSQKDEHKKDSKEKDKEHKDKNKDGKDKEHKDKNKDEKDKEHKDKNKDQKAMEHKDKNKDEKDKEHKDKNKDEKDKEHKDKNKDEKDEEHKDKTKDKKEQKDKDHKETEKDSDQTKDKDSKKEDKDSKHKDKDAKEQHQDKDSKDKSPKEKDSKDKSPKEKDSKDKSHKQKDSKDKSPKEKDSMDKSPKEKDSKDKSPKQKDSKDKSPKEKDSKDKSPKEKDHKEKDSKDKSPKDKDHKDSKDKSPKEKDHNDASKTAGCPFYPVTTGLGYPATSSSSASGELAGVPPSSEAYSISGYGKL